MSKVVHAKPVWGWSVVLLSTLLLSPVAGTAALQALLAQASAAAAAQPATGGSSSQPASAALLTAPCRSDDEWALRLRAQNDRPLTLRFDTQPDVVAVLVPARSVLLVPDEDAASAVSFALAAFGLPPLPLNAATPPRAPPA